MSGAGDIVATAQAYAARHAMFAPGQPVLVAVSGGLDSMVLLHVLRELGLAVHVAHFDHETRGGASAEDAAFVAQACAKLGVPCTVGHWRDWPVETVGTPSFEMEARARRYRFLLHTARAGGCDAVATGHHADDQAETVLMRVLRGTGPGGLAGIAPVREEKGIHVARPLLACTRAEVTAWAEARGIAWREDVSNLDSGIVRNRLRHGLLPQLAESYNPNVREALTRLAETARLEDDLLARLSGDMLRAAQHRNRLARAPLRAAHEALLRRALLGWLRENEIAADHELLARVAAFCIDATTGQQLSLDAANRLHAAGEEILLVSSVEDAVKPVALAVPSEAVFLGQRYVARVLEGASKDDVKALCTPAYQIFDADRLGNALTLRTRRDGDAFVPLGMRGHRKLQDYFVDRRVAMPDRARVPLLESGGELAWVVGHAPGAHFAVTAETRRLASVEVIDAPE